MKTIKCISIAVTIIATSFIQKSNASVEYFIVNWSGETNGNSARATALIGIDTATIPNPGTHDFDSAIPMWFDNITLTISGATSGTGTFTKTDFEGVNWNTAPGGTLDFDRELFDQERRDGIWGVTGEFNLFRSSGSPLAPTGTGDFELTPSGSSNAMSLISFKPQFTMPTNTVDIELSIFQSIELIFPTKTNAIYQVQVSTNLIEWIDFKPFLGNGATNALHLK